MKKLFLIILLFTLHNFIAQNFSFTYSTTGKRVCLAEAVVSLTPPSVTVKLSDASSNTANTTNIYKRPLYGTSATWTLVASALPAGTTQWIDVNVSIGDVWEYKIKRTGTWSYNSQTYDATGYAVGAVLKDNSPYQGRMILLVANNIVSGLPAKYMRLKKELTGEGWLVNELIVPKANGWDSGDTVVGIRNQIATIYNSAPANDKPKTIFILGHVPMPRCGSSTVTAPDGHNQNKGARGCDGYYADVDGAYTDTATFNPGGLQTNLAINLPGDYKWDQDFFPSDLEMSFGRVDFKDIITYTVSELQLTENYLDRLSNYKNVASGFNMGSKTGFYYGYDNSNDGSYRTLPNISKSANFYQNTVGTPHPQWVQTNGPFKVYMQNSGFPDLSEWDTYGMNSTVFSSDQSYWGFNDVPQDFYYSRIRALLAANSKCLVTLWTTTGVNIFHHACMGDPLGRGVKEIMNHNSTNNLVEKPQQAWDASDWWNRTHFSYNGDPTLRLYQLAPPSNLTINNSNNNAALAWTASPDTLVAGYHVYKSTSEFGIYNRITTSPLTALSYTDNTYQNSEWYMVRAVRAEGSGCGIFMNPSMGIFVMGSIITSVKENKLNDELNVFPNPASDKLNVTSDYLMQSVSIINISGEIILRQEKISQKTITLDISKLMPGIYILKANGEKASATQKIIIN